MKITDDEMLEFKSEAFELIDNAEKSLLAIEEGADFSEQYNSIFRAFHCIKGSAGMLELVPLQSHMHRLETTLNKYKDGGALPKDIIDSLLSGCDSARSLFDGDLQSSEETSVEVPALTPAVPLSLATEPLATKPPTIDPPDAASAEACEILQFLLQVYPDLDAYYEEQGRELDRDFIRRKIFDFLRGQRNAG